MKKPSQREKTTDSNSREGAWVIKWLEEMEKEGKARRVDPPKDTAWVFLRPNPRRRQPPEPDK